MVGLDTGFFISLMKSDSKAVDFWNSLGGKDYLPSVSILTIGEILYISYRLGKPKIGKTMVDNIFMSSRVLPIDRAIIEKAASLKAGQDIPYVDSIIIASFMLNNCREFHTTDGKHFSKLKNKGIKIILY